MLRTYLARPLGRGDWRFCIHHALNIAAPPVHVEAVHLMDPRSRCIECAGWARGQCGTIEGLGARHLLPGGWMRVAKPIGAASTVQHACWTARREPEASGGEWPQRPRSFFVRR